MIVAWINTPVSSFEIKHHPKSPSESVDEIYKLLRSSEEVERRFCGFCGTHLTYQNAQDRESGWIDVTFGSLDNECMQGLKETDKVKSKEEEEEEEEKMRGLGHFMWDGRLKWWVEQVSASM